MTRIIFFVLAMSLSSERLFSQKSIEKFLSERQLVTNQQLKKYYEKKKADDSYVRMMIALMKRDKETKAHALEMEKEYKAGRTKEIMNNDTLEILQNILQVTCGGKNINDTNENKNLTLKLSEFTFRLTKEYLISKSDAEKINNTIESSWLFDSCIVVSRAIEYRHLSRITTSSKLLRLMDTLNALKILSDVNYQKLISAPIHDSASKITYILSFCENVFISRKGPFISDENDFFSTIDSLSKLSNLQVSDVKLEFITLNQDSTYFKAIPVIKAVCNGRQFIHECYEVSTTRKEFVPYTLAGHDFYQIFNRILAHNSSPYRVYEVREKNPMQWIQGFILLTENQRNALYSSEQLELSFADHNKALTSQQISQAVDFYTKSGFFKDLSQKSIDSVIADTRQNPVFRYNELISRFPVSVTIKERIPLTVSQAEFLIKKMAAISNYAFDPQNIRLEKNSHGNWELVFEESGVPQRHEFYSFINWEGIWGLIHNAIFSNVDRKAQFEVLRFEQYRESYIFITHKQMEMLKKLGVIDDY